MSAGMAQRLKEVGEDIVSFSSIFFKLKKKISRLLIQVGG
jgi:hypothetical protein